MKKLEKNQRRKQGIKQRKSKQSFDRLLPLPTDERIASIAKIIEKSVTKEELRRNYAPVKTILTMLGVGTVLGLSLISPTALMLAKPFLDAKREKERQEWKRFNPYFLKRTIARLKKQKMITIINQNGEQVVTLTKHGKRRILRYGLDELNIEKPKSWDRKWRLVIYDVSEQKRGLRDVFRRALQSLGFYKLQDSVWIYPYPCEDQIAFLREYFGVGNDVLYVVAIQLEDDTPYRTYFGI